MEKVKDRRLRDMGLRPTYVVYTLTAFVLATMLLFLLTRCLDSIRVGLYYEYKEMATVYPVPPGGDVDITWDAVSHVTILNSEGQIVENLSVDMSQNKLEQSFDTEEMTFQVVVTPVYSDTTGSCMWSPRPCSSFWCRPATAGRPSSRHLVLPAKAEAAPGDFGRCLRPDRRRPAGLHSVLRQPRRDGTTVRLL